MSSPSEEEYLEAIYKLQQIEQPVRPSRIATHLNLSGASVAEMIRKLVERDLIQRYPDASVALTEKGKQRAVSLVRKHRLSERFLTDVLGLSWDKVHDEACKFEHIVSPEVEDGMERLLEDVATCPHGYPIPTRDGVVVEEPCQPLSNLTAGQKCTILRVSEEEPKMLQYLATLGLMPRVEVEVEQVAPFGGPLLIQVNGPKYALGREVAAKILVTKEEG